ncbi:MAG TPA: methylenetetrahydrofolate reductase C-terminal domain-containing protein [Bryobacteraceae bacterium]|jgi:methylenetetrahydrofolate reductase (NADPH)
MSHATPNPIRETLGAGRFCYMVELVASASAPEERVFEAASKLAGIPGLVAAGITSYAGGSMGHDPIRIGAGVRTQGLAPNIHLTCVNKYRQDLRAALDQIQAMGVENVFAITGDYPSRDRQAAGDEPFFDIDSVQLVETINELRQAQGYPFYISVAVSPFKYTEADCVYQYLKLEKKIAAGADFAITQLGYDSRKLRELKRYLTEKGLKTPVFGNVYILPAGAARKFSKGEPPGCWVSQELLERVQEEAKAPDKGLAARLERAARMVAIVRGLGYAGAYIGGSHNDEHIRWIVQRSEEIAPQWEQFAEEISYPPKNGFFYFESKRPKRTLPLPWRITDTVAALFPVKKKQSKLRAFIAGIFRWADKRPAVAHFVERAELAFKQPVFGCKACGNCVLGEMEYVCPMTCPKNLRNGPCGGTLMGQCEVLPDKACIWVKVYEHAQAANRVDDLKVFIPARNRALQGTSSFINLFLNRDSRPGNPQPLITIQPAPETTLANAGRGAR